MKLKHTYQQKAAAWLTGVLLLASATMPALAQRDTRSLNDGWRFRQGACTAARDSAFDDSRWTSVHLPHSWNADAYTEKAYYRGEGWYRRRLHLPGRWEGKRIVLRLDGASKAVTLFVNGREVGEHAGGYTASAFDLTPYLSFHAPNVLALRVDNARQDIPPISGDFTFFGGIYRDVWLTAVPQQHFRLTDLGSESLFVSTPRVSDEEGSVAIRGTVENSAAQQAELEVVFRLYDPDDRLLQTHKKKINLKGGESGDFRCETSLIPHPQLWTPETPRLYRVETLLVDRKTQAVLDRSERHTAFRWFRFDAEQGFSLNGRPYKLRGICRHQDQRPFGPALTDEMHRRDFLLMKEMGANFIRISHYPQDDALLEMCDRLGMLAWEEIPVIDIVPDTPGYADCCERNLREMIRQHYNHPSIILWGYMNEILLVTPLQGRGAAGRRRPHAPAGPPTGAGAEGGRPDAPQHHGLPRQRRLQPAGPVGDHRRGRLEPLPGMVRGRPDRLRTLPGRAAREPARTPDDRQRIRSRIGPPPALAPPAAFRLQHGVSAAVPGALPARAGRDTLRLRRHPLELHRLLLGPARRIDAAHQQQGTGAQRPHAQRCLLLL